MNEELLSYYNSELNYIRQLGDEFAQAYPKIAGRLRISERGSQDPHVERLLEGFAFLTARIRKKLDDEFPDIAEGILNTLFPHFLAPIPSMSILQFVLDKTAGKLTSGYSIPRHATLESESVGGEPCRFRSCYPVTIWPLELLSASLDGPPFRVPRTPGLAAAKCVLRLQLKCLNEDISIGQLGIPSLRFYLHGARTFVQQLYELIFNRPIEVAVSRGRDDAAPRVLDAGALQPVGFNRGEELLPYSVRTPRAYQLLTDYFAFPEKFLFVEFTGLGPALQDWTDSTFDLYVYLNHYPQNLGRFVSASTFRLGCAPVVNLFAKTAEPIRVTQQQSEYEIIPDARRKAAMEIYSVDRVKATDTAASTVRNVAPLFSIKRDENSGMYWLAARRQGRWRENQLDTGTDLFLSLIDLDFDPVQSADTVLTIETTCLNRDLPAELPFGGGRPVFHLEMGGPIARVDCLVHPTPTRRRKLGKGLLWRLISHLSLNYLSITDGTEGAEALRELLRVYDSADAIHAFPYDGILNISSKRVVGRIQRQANVERLRGAGGIEPGFGQGVEVHVELDEDRFVGAGWFLFATVLERFLASYCSVNSFSKMVLSTKQSQMLRRWPPRTGDRVLL